MSGIFTDTEMNEQYQEDDDFNQQEELVSDQDMMDEQNEFEQDFRDEFTEGAFFSESDMSDYILEAAYAVDSVQDITSLKFSENVAEKIGKYHFSTLHLAFDFYMKYLKSKGFSARKSKTFKNSSGEIYRQMFVCHRQGFRMEKYYTMEKRKKEPRLETRTGCEPRMDVKFVPESGRWHIFYFSDEHNHDLLDTQFSAMLPAHRKMSEEDIMQMMNMLKSGINTSQIFGLLASQVGGYEFVGYGPRDMYNEIVRQRHQIPGDAARVLKKLEDMRLKDPQLYFKACHDSRGLLRNLFWSNGISQLDYRLFGDVIAFDATYKKNKYNCPLVIFSGVNHHNQTIVFAAALIANETINTYIWLLRQLMFAMRGKTPTSIITDGAMAIRNAVRDVFPEVKHRLCAWHLIRNATSNVGNPSFTSKFRKIMTGDYEIPVFKRKWVQLIEEFGIEDKPWVINMYKEKHMWAIAYLREKFFAGFRTTSRCEGLHSVVGRYVGLRYDLTSFVEHFQRCVAHMRFNEFNADYESTRGVPVMQTCIELLERYAAELYTHEIFLFFRPFLSRAGSMRVLNIDNTDDCIKYIVCKHGRPDFTWTVDFRQEEMIFMCTNLRMESFGIPCEHIVKVMVDRDIREIPRSLVLDRWTKKVKSALNDPSGFTRDAVVISRQSALVEFSKQLAAVAAKVPERYEETRDLIMGLYSSYKAADEGDNQPHSGVARSSNPYVHPTTGGSGQPSKKKKRQRCSVCQMEGHKKTTCPWQKDIDNNVIENEAIGSDDGDMCTEATAELDSDS
ncbi:protein FAR1-RELATED SEQUENCE 5-like [Arachis stenosperma]|uniref:protein FAR1-RELATED SEQUENCE 5-like n=1 Tax=Arachis stenosperma TaxID=217475 RepID=UPI0025ABD7FA|nr:protein FAR1-RELATED SEQUENCE 5-like [Arachis stenosperma]